MSRRALDELQRGVAPRAAGIASLLVLALGAGALASHAAEVHHASDDPILDGDVIDPSTGRAAVIVPGTPWVRPGPDGVFGSEDDEIFPGERGDVDLVVRTEAIAQALQIGVCEPFGRGVPIEYVALPGDGQGATHRAPPYFDGLAILGLAFADLDADGFIGVTELDGDPNDGAIEAAELWPVGRRYVIAEGNEARGMVVVTRGGPAGAEVDIAIAAIAYAGPLREEFFEARIPDGPAIMTRLPFLPVTGVDVIIPTHLDFTAADPAGRVAPRTEIAYRPDPSDPRVGEAFTLRLDGSDPTIGLARAQSGEPVRFGVAVEPEADHYLPLAGRSLRPGLDEAGEIVPYEVPRFVRVHDDGEASVTRVRVVALDRLGNIATPAEPTRVWIKTGKGVRIVEPGYDDDDDDDERRYASVLVTDARGAELVLDDSKSAYDDESLSQLILRADDQIELIELLLPDPDVDDDGKVTPEDAMAIEQCLGREIGEYAFVPQLDLDANGRIDAADLQIVQRDQGLKPKKDKKSKVPKRLGACFDGKLSDAKRLEKLADEAAKQAAEAEKQAAEAARKWAEHFAKQEEERAKQAAEEEEKRAKQAAKDAEECAEDGPGSEACERIAAAEHEHGSEHDDHEAEHDHTAHHGGGGTDQHDHATDHAGDDEDDEDDA